MRVAVILALVLAAVGCAVEATENSPAVPAARTAAIPDSGQARIAGTVLETLDASSYTYVRLETADGEAWAAVPRAEIEVGAPIEIANPMTMSGFESKALGRRFESIYFGTLAQRPGPAAASIGGSNPHAMGASAGEGSAPIEVDRAGGSNGRTVAELYAERGSLAGQAVALRGRVVKYSAGIMGRNWIHLQDGSGEAADGSNDITVTSSATTAVGETVLIEGTVAVDKDFGAGYRYAVIVEDARVE